VAVSLDFCSSSLLCQLYVSLLVAPQQRPAPSPWKLMMMMMTMPMMMMIVGDGAAATAAVSFFENMPQRNLWSYPLLAMLERTCFLPQIFPVHDGATWGEQEQAQNQAISLARPAQPSHSRPCASNK